MYSLWYLLLIVGALICVLAAQIALVASWDIVQFGALVILVFGAIYFLALLKIKISHRGPAGADGPWGQRNEN